MKGWTAKFKTLKLSRKKKTNCYFTEQSWNCLPSNGCFDYRDVQYEGIL